MNAYTNTLFKYFCLLAISSIGLERLNVFPWSGSFIQPFYLLSIPLVWVMWQAKIKSLQITYVALLIVLAASLVANGLFDAYHLKKFVLLGYVLAVSFSLAAYIYINNLEELFIKALKIYVLLNLVITFGQLLAFFEGNYLSSQLDSSRFINLGAIVIGDYFRPSGFSFDANKGMFNFSYALICLSLLSAGGWLWMKLMYPLTFLAHSRSTILSMLPALFARSRFYAALSVVLYLAVLSLLTPHSVAVDRLSSMNSTGAVAVDRLSSMNSTGAVFDNNSSNVMRIELIKLWAKGMDSASPEQVIFGHGIASSGVYLEKNLGTNYGDFASGYLTIIYEFGLAGILLLGMIFIRLWRTYDSKSRYMLLIPLMVFQMFYANLAEPLILVALSYFFLKHHGKRIDDQHKNCVESPE